MRINEQEEVKEIPERIAGEDKNEQGGDKERETKREKETNRKGGIEQKGLVTVCGTCKLYKV